MAYHKVIGTHNHTQSVAADVWTIVHNLALPLPIVDCWTTDNSVLTSIIPVSITATDSNTVVITFSSARTGFASVI